MDSLIAEYKAQITATMSNTTKGLATVYHVGGGSDLIIRADIQVSDEITATLL